MSASQSPADWAAMTSLAVGFYAALCVPYFLLVDVDLDVLRDDAREAIRRTLTAAAVTAAALLLLLSAPRPEVSR